MALVRFQCCICGEHIEKGSRLDPCYVSIVSNLDEPASKQREQAFFSHYECFRNSMDSGVSIHLNLEDQRL